MKHIKLPIFQRTIEYLILIAFFILLASSIAESQNNEIYVDNSYQGHSDGSVQQPYPSIQTAIDEAEPGDTIYVFGGLYDELITVDKQLSLWGGVEGTDSIINADDDVRYTMTITADNVEIQDFKFTDENNVKTSPIGALLSVQAENVVITSNQFYETDSYGIHIDETASRTAVNANTIYNTEFGIVVESSDTNDIFNNEIYNCIDAGISLENTAENRLYDNTIYDCSKAILASYCSGLNITNNEFYNTDYAGMLLQNCQQVIVQENTIHDNTGSGLYITSDYCTISENDFEANQRGITLGGNNNDITKNQFTTCVGLGIFALATSKQNTIYNNTFEENGKNAEDNGNNNWYTGENGNYWDDYNWIDLDQDGIGDRSYTTNGVVDEYPLGFFLHPPNKPSSPVPGDAASGVGLKLDLKVKIVDEDSSSLDVTFYNAENDEQIGIDKKVTSGEYASCNITLKANTVYAWYAHVTDGIQENVSDTFFFTTMVTPPDNEPPVADSGGQYYSEPGQPISFDASESSDGDGEIDFYRWNFGDGTGELLAKQPTHTYQNDGIYTVTLTVIDNLGATDTQTFSVPVRMETNQRPTADPGGPYQRSIVDENIMFDGTKSSDSDGELEEYVWDFGDDTTGSGATITHSYSEAGSYLVTLTVTDNYGESHTESTIVSIELTKELESTNQFFEKQNNIYLFSTLGLIFLSAVILIVHYNRKSTKKRKHYEEKKVNESSTEDTSDLKNRIREIKNKDILTSDIEQKLSKGEIKQASQLVTEREKSFEEYNRLKKKLKTIKTKGRKLTGRLADGEIDSDSYKKAFGDLEKQEKEIEEKLWKLRNKLFKDDYEKPF